MVFIDRPDTAPTGKMQLRVATPSKWMVHAPQTPIPQPNLVPCSLSVSRRTHSNGVSGATSSSCCRPLTVRIIAMTSAPLWRISELPRRLLE